MSDHATLKPYRVPSRQQAEKQDRRGTYSCPKVQRTMILLMICMGIIITAGEMITIIAL
jgi:hypothetical protein